jgi:hypothetical protein
LLVAWPGNDFIEFARSDLGSPVDGRHVPCDGRCMNLTIESLATLQALTKRAAKSATKAHQATISQLRATLPVSALVYFDRRVTRGHQAVAEVRNGVCMSCHLRVPVGTVAGLGTSPELVTCESCGSYLRLAPDADASSTDSRRRSRVIVRSAAKGIKPVATIPARGHQTIEIIHAEKESVLVPA